eukprot:441406-Prymnesium_polylepis.1
MTRCVGLAHGARKGSRVKYAKYLRSQSSPCHACAPGRLMHSHRATVPPPAAATHLMRVTPISRVKFPMTEPFH